MKKLLLFFSVVCCLWTTNSNAQLESVINEEYATHAAGLADIPAGYSTYRIYALLTNPTDRISAVFGSTSPSPIHHAHIYSSAGAPSIYNAPATGTLGTDDNCLFWGFPGFGGMPYDSYVTFQAADAPADPCPQCAPTGTIFQISAPSGVIPATFGGPGMGPDMTMVDGSWFIPNDGSCFGFPSGVDNRILIAQVTVPTGTLEYWLNIAVFNEAIGADQLIYVHTQQDPTMFVGTIPEIDGNCLGLVYPDPVACLGVAGCNDPAACNFDPAATSNDGSCYYPEGPCDVAGYANLTGNCATSVCSYDSFCCNTAWDSICAGEAATDANCAYCLSTNGAYGCTDLAACNYNAAATCSNSAACTYPDGCNDPAACNFNPGATCNDGSCLYAAPLPGACNATGYADLAGPCATSVCSYDSFCCNTSWDSICANEATTDANCAYCVTALAVLGCMDSAACNYNAAATCDDGSCIYPVATPGVNCDEVGYADLGGACATSVCSYDSFCCATSWDSICANEATTDANCAYCLSNSLGCTDPAACNYNDLAGCDDGSCTYPDGCTDPAACNYNPFATCDDGSCVYAAPLPGACNATGYADLAGPCATSVCSYDSFCCNTSWDSICANEASTDANCAYCATPLGVLGCTDPAACNYNAAAQCDDGSCIYPVATPGVNCDETGYADLGGACATSVCSYDSFCCNTAWDSICANEASTDANCAYCLSNSLGCTDPGACNYNDLAGCDDGSCTYPDGCTDPEACNYNPAATCDDGSCIYEDCAVSGYSDLGGPCATSVCSYDSFCCNTSWDSICANEATTDANCAYCVGGTAIVGCTDPAACNYDAGANCDDGSCILPVATPGVNCDETGYADLGGACATSVCSYDSFCCNTSWDSICANEASTDANCAYCLSNSLGCTDPAACNYNDLAGCDDGSCTYPGCTDVAACNYNPFAGCSDTSCIYPDGCNDPNACNYDPAALCNDGSCDYGVAVDACDQTGYTDLGGACATSVCSYDSFCCNTAWDSICANEASTDANCTYCLGGQFGCTDPAACNYNAAAQCDDGSCYYPDGCTDPTACNYDALALCDDGSCILPDGCTDPTACNYDALALCDDGSCILPDGCTDPTACNYDALALCDDGSCILPDGCTDPTACNYDALALCDDGSCTYPDGCIDPLACNFDALATCDDGSCDYSCYGCTDPIACNYDPAATIDDGTCTYAPCIANDVPAGAIGLAVTMLGTCTSLSDDASLASDSPESQAAGADLWYSFTAVTSGARIEVVDVGGQNLHVELFTAGLVSLDYENVVAGNGTERLNIGNLTPGNTYLISVTGSGMYDICVQWIPETDCDYGPGPYSLCGTFKLDWVGANAYTLYLESTTTFLQYSKYQNSPVPGTFFVLNTVPNLPWGDTYTAWGSSHWNLSTGAGMEMVEVLGSSSCTVIVSPQPVTILRPSDNCANHGPHLIGSTIAAQPFVCGAVNWEWEFTRTDVPELPFLHLRGSSNRFMPLATVPGLVLGATYDVRVRPIFATAPSSFGPLDCVSLVGPAMFGELPSDEFAANEDKENVIESALYPNPNAGEFVNINLTGIESETVIVKITDTFGKLVFEQKYTVEGSLNQVITFDNPLAAGTYNVSMIAGENVRNERLVVTR